MDVVILVVDRTAQQHGRTLAVTLHQNVVRIVHGIKVFQIEKPQSGKSCIELVALAILSIPRQSSPLPSAVY